MQELHDAMVNGQADFLAQRDEKRLVAGGAKDRLG
jgi:hypothetical protein